MKEIALLKDSMSSEFVVDHKVNDVLIRPKKRTINGRKDSLYFFYDSASMDDQC